MGDLPKRLRVTPLGRLTHPIDLEERIARATPEDTLKGMFFQSILDAVRQAGVDAERVALQAAPTRLRYLAFYDYPVADYFRLVAATAKALHPREALSEGIRRVGGRDFAKFAESSVGKVMLAFTGDAASTLLRSTPMYGAVLKGRAKIAAERISDGVRISYRDYPGLTEVYPVGTIESTCRHYGVDYEIDIEIRSPWDADYEVHLGRGPHG